MEYLAKRDGRQSKNCNPRRQRLHRHPPCPAFFDEGRRGGGAGQPGEGGPPEGAYDGTYVDDYEYREGSGDLDECNGMTVNGTYGYYVTASYPWVLKCFRGTPDPSFNKRSR